MPFSFQCGVSFHNMFPVITGPKSVGGVLGQASLHPQIPDEFTDDADPLIQVWRFQLLVGVAGGISTNQIPIQTEVVVASHEFICSMSHKVSLY
jgi:hypothetical protein